MKYCKKDFFVFLKTSTYLGKSCTYFNENVLI